jgi:hypothetical protein
LVLYSRTAQKINPNDSKLKKEKARLEMVFYDFDPKATFSPSTFSDKKYVSIDGTDVKGKGRYTNYKIINGLKTNK